MYKVNFYRDKNGKQPVKEYLQELKNKGGKDSKIKFNKINDYIEVLSKYGTYAGEPYIKHLEGDIWELRPLSDRILFVAWYKNEFMLLHHFVKKTQKTPSKEIEKAKRELKDLKERGYVNE